MIHVNRLPAIVLSVWLLAAAAFSAEPPPSPGPEARTWTVALDGSAQFRSIQAAVDEAKNGDTILIKPGAYPEDVTIHSKERLKLVGESADRVIVLGREQVGSFHIGKWPYGATDIEISGLTINEHGGHALGIFNGQGIVLHDLHVKGMVFGQQVQNVRIENSVIGGSETTGVQLADSEAALVGNVIHDNDHGVTVAGRSDVRLERNVITHSLFEGVVVSDRAHATLIQNTIVKNGGGAAFLGTSRSEARGNIVGFNKVGFVIAPTSQVVLSHNAVYNLEGNYLRAGSPQVPAPDLQPPSDIAVDPRFVDLARDDFRLALGTPLTQVGGFAYLGALPPLPANLSPLK